jgi:hypothetical protein
MKTGQDAPIAPSSDRRPIDAITPSSRANRWTLIGFIVLILPIAILAIGSTVMRALDVDFSSNDTPSGQSADDEESGIDPGESTDGVLVLIVVAVVATTCVATPLVLARRRRRTDPGATVPGEIEPTSPSFPVAED